MDDGDMQTAYLYGFLDVAKRFVAAAKRIGDPDLSEQLVRLDMKPEHITEAFDLKAELIGIIDYLRQESENADYGHGLITNTAFIDEEVVAKLKSTASATFDLTKLARFCEEINDSYRRGNYLACALLIRAVMNHVPPICGAESFSQVVAQSGKSIKAMLTRLEEARPIADLHTHMQLRARESLPTKNQVDFKASFEVLIQEVLAKID